MAPGDTGQRTQQGTRQAGLCRFGGDCAQLKILFTGHLETHMPDHSPGASNLPLLPEATLGEALCQPTESISSLYFMLSEIASE